MKKNFIKGISAFFLLFGALNTSQAQVKVGDNPTTINANSVLEIESTNKGLLLPRVALTSAIVATPMSAHVSGMTVYNTATAGTAPDNVTPGFYYNNGTRWVAVKDGYLTAEIDGVIGNEVADATANMGLARVGAGTAASPYTLGLTPGTSANQSMVWNGTSWVPGSAGLVSTALTSTTAPAGTAVGEMVYNTNAASGVPVGPTYWDGTTWQPIATTEPWKDAATGTVATANTQNIYQMGNVGIGMNTPTSQLQTAGAISTPVSATSVDVTLNNSNSVVKIDTTSGDKTVTLPAAASAIGRIYTVVKTDGTANKIIFSATIKGSDFTFTQANVPGAYQIQSDGTDWVLIE
ncbi:MAG: hypothetical protein ACH34V_00025 [Flavobacterium sp.]|uniref:hypothetical protein n=1 Tax=Flavobacterium sp. TaxID=239 RepID=UPI0037BD5E0F